MDRHGSATAPAIACEVAGTKLDAEAVVQGRVKDRNGGRTPDSRDRGPIVNKIDFDTPRPTSTGCGERSKPSLTPNNREVGPMLECARVAFTITLGSF
jgi:hypothetical protein